MTCRVFAMLAFAVHLTAAAIATAQQKPAAPPIELTVTAAAAPEPALRYELLPGVLDEKPGNAALHYYQAIIQLMPVDAAAAHDLLDQPRDQWPSDTAKALLSQHHVIALARQGAVRLECDFGYMLREEGVSAVMVGLSEFRQLGWVVALHAADAVAAGRNDQALAHLQTLIAMSRHQSDSKALIQALVGVRVADEAFKQLEALIQRGDAPNFYWALTNLPSPLIDMRAVLRFERPLVLSYRPALVDAAKARTPEQRRAVAAAVAELREQGLDGRPMSEAQRDQRRVAEVALALALYPQAKQWLTANGLSAQEADAMPVAEALALYSHSRYEHWRDEAFKLSGLPYHQIHGPLRETELDLARASAEAFPMWEWMPSVSRSLLFAAKLDRRIAMLRVIEAVRLHVAEHGTLPGALEQVTIVPIPVDPVTNQPFGYSASGNTFTLTAAPPPGHVPAEGSTYRVTVKPASPPAPQTKE